MNPNAVVARASASAPAYPNSLPSAKPTSASVRKPADAQEAESTARKSGRRITRDISL